MMRSIEQTSVTYVLIEIVIIGLVNKQADMY